MLLDGHEMQALAARRIVAPGLPGGEEIQAQAEAGFENDKTVPALPAGRQIVAAEKDMAGLCRAAVGRVIDIAVGAGDRRAVGSEFEAGRDEAFHLMQQLGGVLDDQRLRAGTRGFPG